MRDIELAVIVEKLKNFNKKFIKNYIDNNEQLINDLSIQNQLLCEKFSQQENEKKDNNNVQSTQSQEDSYNQEQTDKLEQTLSQKEYGLTRKECKILYCLLDNQNEDKIYLDDFIYLFWDNSDCLVQLCQILPGIGLNEIQHVNNLQFEEEDALKIFQKICCQIEKKQIRYLEMNDIFRLQDWKQIGAISLDKFQICFDKLNIDIDKQESKYIHELCNNGQYKIFLDQIQDKLGIENDLNIQKERVQNEINQNENLQLQKDNLGQLLEKYSNNKTEQMKIQHLEFQNAKLRQQNQEILKQNEYYKLQNEELQQKIQQNNEKYEIDLKEKEDNNFSFIKENYLNKEIEIQTKFKEILQEKEQQFNVYKQRSENQIQKLEHEITNKQQQIDNLKSEIEGLMKEMGYKLTQDQNQI
ncbi:hypothetical protein PPERSA_06916 [Pseudocohnilembus persalinus]|uniref:EF-hand domain-containing protein n=1 Tax=Pseudocohnilembus persalinus TaxID=266149 RepID=A0A0V0QZH6_PSEPJ|nr:hypothetical protein PPERSA_06916 [Pseudocohnilembus persalinus]|eukprot:KRX07301.1 hypothetical protein PPERSA_06916 [Pseudocohnilembus persalinus]